MSKDEQAGFGATMKKVAPRILSPLSERILFTRTVRSMLPDYLAPHLEIVFVGLNPGTYSDQVGHYFARKQNAFWTALHESGLVPEPLTPQDDGRLPQFGFGLTDIVKRATPNTDSIAEAEFVQGGQTLRAHLEPLAPRIVCFVGLIGYRSAFDRKAMPGPQGERWGNARLFIVPSTSPRNARYRNDIVHWFEKLRLYLEELKGAER